MPGIQSIGGYGMSLGFDLIQPHKCEACGHLSQYGVQVFTTNITHNLGAMARACGCYTALWRPDELDYKFAREVEPAIQLAIGRLRVSPSYYRQFDANN